MADLYLGMISGTSVDGVDAVLTELDDSSARIVAAETRAFPAPLHRRLTAMIDEPRADLTELGGVDVSLGAFFADCALELIAAAGFEPADVVALGHHGQTVFHRPDPPEPFTLQLGDPNVVAARTGIATVADFRRMDVALGGQGAPLVPAFHAWHFGAAHETRAVVNIGGIANVTLLSGTTPAAAFDTGPGNTLLDRWIERCLGVDRDENGEWAAGGSVDCALLDALLEDEFFARPPPKSTGRERFNAAWLERHLAAAGRSIDARDVQATLAELTAETIAAALRGHAPDTGRLIVCGGGAHNGDLLRRLRRASGIAVESSARHGIAPDWVEGAAFAWLAYARLAGLPGNAGGVTGARRSAVLGAVYRPPGSRADTP